MAFMETAAAKHYRSLCRKDVECFSYINTYIYIILTQWSWAFQRLRPAIDFSCRCHSVFVRVQGALKSQTHIALSHDATAARAVIFPGLAAPICSLRAPPPHPFGQRRVPQPGATMADWDVIALTALGPGDSFPSVQPQRWRPGNMLPYQRPSTSLPPDAFAAITLIALRLFPFI